MLSGRCSLLSSMVGANDSPAVSAQVLHGIVVLRHGGRHVNLSGSRRQDPYALLMADAQVRRGPAVTAQIPRRPTESGTSVAARAPGQSREITAVTRRDVFDFQQAEAGPWWGRLDEVDVLEELYYLDALPSTDPRHATAAEDIIRHRVANLDWDDDWVFSDPRFQLAEGPDQVLLDFLARMTQPSGPAGHRAGHEPSYRLNSLLAPYGWNCAPAARRCG